MNNREKATLIWLAIALAAAMTQREIRESLWACVKAFASLKLIGPLLMFGGWTVALVALAHSVGLWDADVRNDTVTWFITAGVALFFSLHKATERGFFRKAARRAIAVTAFVEGFANLEVFGLAVELMFLPLMFLLGGMLVVSESEDQFAPVRKMLNGLITVIGAVVLVYVLVHLAADFDASHTLRALALPVWLTVGSVPIAYAMALAAEYEQAFMRIGFHADDSVQRRRAKRALLRAANVRLSELAGFAGHWIGDLTSSESDAEARTLMHRWRSTWRAERHAERMRDAREYMKEWLTQTDPVLAEIHLDLLRRAWERLDEAQRDGLRDEGARLASSGAASEELATLPA